MEDDEQPVASGSGTLNGGANVNGFTPQPSSFADLLNPSEQPNATPFPDPIPVAPELPGASTSQHVPGDLTTSYQLAAPMQVGAMPDVSAMEFAGPLDAVPDAGTLLPLPSGPASLPIGMQALFHSAPDTTPSVRFADDVFERDMTPVVGSDAALATAASPIAVDPPTPEPLPDFVLSQAAVEAFKAFLRDETDALNVDQLEQLRAACYDIIWRGRKAWDRSEMIDELDGLAREFVNEVRETRA